MVGDSAFRRLRDRLASMGFHPSRRRGQNFLVDGSLCRLIAGTLDPGPLVLEVGAGTGALTRELARRAGRVLAVEVDRRLFGLLLEEREGWEEGARVRLLHASALEGPGLSPALVRALREEGALPRRYACVSNLPYGLAGPILAALATTPLPPGEILCLCQREMAGRILAPAGSRSYGSLSVLLTLAWAPELLRLVGPQVFRPRPKVDSALLRLGPREGGFLARRARQREAFGSFCRGLFSHRRKKVARTLQALWQRSPAEVLQAAGRPPEWLDRRPEAFLPLEVLDLFDLGFLDGEEGRS